MNSDTGAAPPAMIIGEFPPAPEKPAKLPRSLDQLLGAYEQDDEAGDLGHLPPTTATSLQLLADTAAGKDFRHRGSTGKVHWATPDLDQRLRAAQALLKLLGADIGHADIFRALGIAKQEERDISTRQLARAVASDITEFRKSLMACLPHDVSDRAAIADQLTAIAMQRYCQWKGTPVELTLADLIAKNQEKAAKQ